jgi:Cation efflux family
MHAEPSGLVARLTHLLAPHSHDVADKVDNALETSREGVRAVTISFAALAVTAVAQAAAVVATGSVALLGDTLHNVADALTAVPLGIAFVLGRRAATRRYTYGYGRAEDLAGIAVVLMIAISAASDRPRWWRTDFTPAPTASRPSPSSSAPPGSPPGSTGPIRLSAC